LRHKNDIKPFFSAIASPPGGNTLSSHQHVLLSRWVSGNGLTTAGISLMDYGDLPLVRCRVERARDQAQTIAQVQAVASRLADHVEKFVQADHIPLVIGGGLHDHSWSARRLYSLAAQTFPALP
jgi:hypothetical protein